MIIKICGMLEAENIRQVDELQADWMGFIFYPRSARYVAVRPAFLPTHLKRVGVFVDAEECFILSHIRDYHLQMVQLHGHESPQLCRSLRENHSIAVIKAFGIHDAKDFEQTEAYEGLCDYYLFDTLCSTAGGSGRSFDHRLLQHYQGRTPFLLSGGIGPEDALEMARFHHPLCCGIDLNSRFESCPAVKDVAQLKAFIHQYQQEIKSKENESYQSVISK